MPIASEGSAGSRLAILGDSTVLEGELFDGNVLEPEPFFTFNTNNQTMLDLTTSRDLVV